MKLKLFIEYLGTNYVGWQRQKDTLLPSIQGEIEKAIFLSCGSEVDLICAGRTDAGVHAVEQVAHFEIDEQRLKLKPYKLKAAINFHLRPNSISITNVERVSDDWNARLSALQKTYIYKIITRDSPSPMAKLRYWQIYKEISEEKLKNSANLFVGKHDFSYFRSSECQAKSPIKTIDEIKIKKQNQKLQLEFKAKSFLHHQIRMIVGTIIQAQMRNIEDSYINDALLCKNKALNIFKAPAHGLYLEKIKY